MPQDFTLTAGSRDGLFSLTATASSTFIGHDYSNSNTYRIDALTGFVNGNQIVSFVHDDRAEIQDYYTANNIDTQEIDGFDRLVFTDSAGVRYTINTLFRGRNAYSESDSRDPINGRTIGVQVTAVCFAEGTLIRTSRGEVAVEHLGVGDLVVTAAGAHRPIRWIGHRAYAGRFANAHPDLLPVCIKANAIADRVPCRDLWVSPKHALFLDGVLVPAAALVNGMNVVKAERVDSLTYWHVELDTHDVLLAENTPAESFVDDEGRGIFHNAKTFHDLYPEAVEAEAMYCAPRVEDGYALEAIRRRLAARAGLLGRAAAA